MAVVWCDVTVAMRLVIRVYRSNVALGVFGVPRLTVAVVSGSGGPRANMLGVLVAYRACCDNSVAVRYSCREGICGSCAMGVLGGNKLACLAFVGLRQLMGEGVYGGTVTVLPLMHYVVWRDLVSGIGQFYGHVAAVGPWVTGSRRMGGGQALMSEAGRRLLEGHYECVFCGCCNGACPSY